MFILKFCFWSFFTIKTRKRWVGGRGAALPFPVPALCGDCWEQLSGFHQASLPWNPSRMQTRGRCSGPLHLSPSPPPPPRSSSASALGRQLLGLFCSLVSGEGTLFHQPPAWRVGLAGALLSCLRVGARTRCPLWGGVVSDAGRLRPPGARRGHVSPEQ